jgi:hypothetical protein
VSIIRERVCTKNREILHTNSDVIQWEYEVHIEKSRQFADQAIQQIKQADCLENLNMDRAQDEVVYQT